MNLLIHIRNGDELAFQQLFEACREKVFNYFVKKTNNRYDAEDLLQTTFLRLWKYRKSLSDDYLIDALRRKVFILHKMEGYSYKEIALKLSVDVKSIDNNISRALKQIRKALMGFFILFF